MAQTATAPTPAAPQAAGVSLPRRGLLALGGRANLVIGVVLLVVFVGLALIGPLVWRTNPNAQPFSDFMSPSLAHPMGTDELGRDTFARVIHGAQISLEVGLGAVGIALVLGSLVGLSASVWGGWVDVVLMRVVDIMFAFPALVFAILMTALLGPNQANETVTIGVVFVPAFARVVRGTALTILAEPYVVAARVLGASRWRIVRREVLRNIGGPLLAVAGVYIANAILIDAGLSFLGLGVQPPTASLGNMLSEAQNYMQLAWWMAVFPGLAIALAVLGFNFLGDGLRDLLDPKSVGRR